jgi:hypothetical protein
MRPSGDLAGSDPAELLLRTREYVERAVVAHPETGFCLSDIATPAQWRAVLSSVIGPAVIWEAVTGAVLGLLPGGLATRAALDSLDLAVLPRPGSVEVEHMVAAQAWLTVDLDRALGTGAAHAPIVFDVMTMGAHRHPSHLSSLVLAIVLVANAAALAGGQVVRQIEAREA